MSSCISRLPDSTTRLISSHLIVVTPVLLVKELLDNAIDAQATSVEILLSPDTISRIEVRDDGVGIHPDDYDALGRRGHTSKLRNISELRDIVGKTLGFRGEALAGVNSMANVTVTTKVSTEPVAAVLQLKPNEGGVLTLKPASAPVGTTVSVTGLFGRQPVRKQMAAKEAKKTLDKIQALLRAYAMARPRLRLLFKVLQTPAKTWSYSPKRNATAMEAVLQLFGADVTSKCLAKRFRRGPSSTDGGHATQGPAQRASDDFMFEAILANPDVDLQKAPKQHFFSVDGRPINAGRGIAKRLLSVYLEHLRHSTLMRNTSDCFIRVDICCRPGSYDANIEPSKDDVLFSNEQVVIDAFKCLCSETYSSVAICQQVAPGEVNTRISGVPIAISQTEDHTLLHQSESQPNSQGCTPQITNSSEISPDVSSQCSKTSVDQEAAVREPASYQRSRETQSSITFKPINARRTPRGLRSGVLAEQVNETTSALEQGKVNVPVGLNEHSERIYRERHQIAVNPSRSQETTVTHEAHILDDRLNPWMIAKSSHLNEAPPPKSPRPPMYSPLSPLTPEPPVLRHIMAPPGDLDLPSGHADMRRARLLRPQQPPVPGGPYRSPMSNPLERKQQANPITPADYSRTNPHRPRPRRRQPPWTPPSVEKPHYSDASLIGPTHLQQTDGFKQTQISFGGTQASHCRRSAQRDIPPTQPGSIGPLNTLGADGHVNIQDMFSTAKKNLQYQLSQIEGDQRPNTVRQIEHQQHCQQHHRKPPRQRQPFSVLQTNTFNNSGTLQEDREPITTTLPTGDPRAYLLRRQKSMAAEESGVKPKKPRRLKSSLMPLENIPPEDHTHSLSWTPNIDRCALEKSVTWARKYDEYVIYGTLLDGLDMSLADGRAVELRLQTLLAQQKENINEAGEGNGPITVDLQTKLKGKSVLDASAA